MCIWLWASPRRSAGAVGLDTWGAHHLWTVPGTTPAWAKTKPKGLHQSQEEKAPTVVTPPPPPFTLDPS